MDLIAMELTEKDLRQAQKIMVMIMKKIHAVCEKHQIKYWLDYGTLIGAVRHEGFIPWDDDFDICMMRADYERFNQIIQEELGDEFFWQTYRTDSAYPFFLGKIRLKNTIWEERSCRNVLLKEKGVFVDVFPIDLVPENKFYRNFLFRVMRYSHLLFIDKKYKRPKLHQKIAHVVLNLISADCFFIMLYRKIINLCSKDTDTSMASLVMLAPKMSLCKKEIFDEVMLHKFEDTAFYIPVAYHQRLQGVFGDYMTPPPISRRYSHHNIVNFDFGKYTSL